MADQPLTDDERAVLRHLWACGYGPSPLGPLAHQNLMPAVEALEARGLLRTAMWASITPEGREALEATP